MASRVRHMPALLALVPLCLLGARGAEAPPADAEAATPSADALLKEVAALQFERLPNGDVHLGGITVHRAARTVSFPAVVNLASGLVEVLIATPEGRLHEALLKADVDPLHLQTALLLLDLRNGPRVPDEVGRQGDILDIDIEWENEEGARIREPVELWIRDQRSRQPMKRVGWVLVGSSVANGVFQATSEGNLVLTYSLGNTVLDSALPESDDDTLFHVNQGKTEPGLAATVRVILTPRRKAEDEQP